MLSNPIVVNRVYEEHSLGHPRSVSLWMPGRAAMLAAWAGSAHAIRLATHHHAVAGNSALADGPRETLDTGGGEGVGGCGPAGQASHGAVVEYGSPGIRAERASSWAGQAGQGHKHCEIGTFRRAKEEQHPSRSQDDGQAGTGVSSTPKCLAPSSCL
jgi:hypothetical protein